MARSVGIGSLKMPKDNLLPFRRVDNICLSTAYLAPVEYYIAIAGANTVYLEKWEQYEKQSYRNRCCIAGPNGSLQLSIPVEKGSDGARMLSKDVRISGHSDWQVQHWRSLESAYNSTPFFEYYKDDFLPFYQKKWTFLWDFNCEIQAKVLELLELNVVLKTSEVYKPILDKHILDLRYNIHPKNKISTHHFISYYQVFEQKYGFIPNLSIIDLLFNMGNESQLVLQNSCCNRNQNSDQNHLLKCEA